jgi:hypothetical protein
MAGRNHNRASLTHRGKQGAARTRPPLLQVQQAQGWHCCLLKLPLRQGWRTMWAPVMRARRSSEPGQAGVTEYI